MPEEVNVPAPKQKTNKRKSEKNISILHISSIIVAVIIVVVIYILVSEQPQWNNEQQAANQTRLDIDSLLSNPEIPRSILKDDETYICMALTSSDISICDKSPKKIENCYNNYYFYNSLLYGINKCDQIKDARKEICNAVIADDINFCENIVSSVDNISADELKVICKALVKNDVSECNPLINEELKIFCNRLINFIKNVKNKDVSACSTLGYLKYITCKSMIMGNAGICVEERVNDITKISEEDCKNKTDELSNVEKSFCEFYY